jgi:hypothetical protein
MIASSVGELLDETHDVVAEAVSCVEPSTSGVALEDSEDQSDCAAVARPLLGLGDEERADAATLMVWFDDHLVEVDGVASGVRIGTNDEMDEAEPNVASIDRDQHHIARIIARQRAAQACSALLHEHVVIAPRRKPEAGHLRGEREGPTDVRRYTQAHPQRGDAHTHRAASTER